MRCQTEAGTFSSVEHNETRKDEVLMAKQDKPTSEGKQQGRGMLWRGVIIRELPVTILGVAALRSFFSPSSPPLPLRIQASPSPPPLPAPLGEGGAIPLPRGAPRFD